MANYVDGYVLAVPVSHLPAYRKMASKAATIWKAHGALTYTESVADDLDTPFGVSFAKLTKAKPDETVVFAWITFKSRAHRDKVNALVQADPRMNEICKAEEIPFNPKRMSWGGFKMIVVA